MDVKRFTVVQGGSFSPNNFKVLDVSTETGLLVSGVGAGIVSKLR